MASTRTLPHIIFLRRLGYGVCGLGLVAILFVLSGRIASANTAPPLDLFEAQAYRSVLEPDDLLMIHRYELVESEADLTIDGWCQYLSNSTDCDSDPVFPSEPTSLVKSRAFTAVYASYTGAPYSGSLEYQVNLPRIGHGLHFAYFAAGHTITWADPAVVVCIDSSQDFFSTSAEQSCVSPDWSGAANTAAAQRADFGTGLRTLIGNLESSLQLPVNFLVDSTVGITPSGAVYAREAFPLSPLLAPEQFQSGSSATIASDFAPSGSESGLQQAIDADSLDLNVSIGWFTDNVLGQSAGLVMTLVFGALGFFVGSVMRAASDKTELFWLGFITVTMAGAALRGPTISTMFAAALLVSSVAAWYVIRKVPA